MRISAKKLWSDGVWLSDRTIVINGGIITDIAESLTGDILTEYLTPGLIDNHIHGGDGISVIDTDADEICDWLVKLAESGVCGVAASPYGKIDEIRGMLSVLREVKRRQDNGEAGGALLLGAHLEGPFISPDRPGSFMPEMIETPSIDSLLRLIDGYEDIVTEMTLAPEVTGNEIIRKLVRRGIKVLAGHTDCTYDQALQAFESGVGATTHTFNACRPLHHREPGLIAAALTDNGIYCELICDLVHLHPGTIRLLYHCKGAGRLMVISDGVSTTNLPDGIYDEKGVSVTVKNGESRLTDGGSLNGGGCYVSRSAKKLYDIGIPSVDLPYMTAVAPAEWLGFDNSIGVGKRAFLTAFGEDFGSAFSVIGDRVYGKDKA